MLDKRGETKGKETHQVSNYNLTNDEDAVRMNLDSMEVKHNINFFITPQTGLISLRLC